MSRGCNTPLPTHADVGSATTTHIKKQTMQQSKAILE
jgi:hypothetical protein